ncbi:MAG: hypothetical protein JWO10_837, partial [Microbacteriaceae bacterium]|nr:hypothetical protein [Microbacteriaceae bacterium]
MADLPEVTAGEAIARLADGAWLIDVREEDEWDRGHARGAH